MNWRREVVDYGPNAGMYSSIATDNLGTPHIAYQVSGDTLRYATKVFSGWTKESLAGGSNIVSGIGNSIAVDGTGRVHIAYGEIDLGGVTSYPLPAGRSSPSRSKGRHRRGFPFTT